MTNRELFQNIMFYRGHDRMPAVHWAEWDETRERWYNEGFPRGADIRTFFGVPAHWAGVGFTLELFPAFPEEIIEETDEYRIFRGGDGVVCKDWKGKSCIPHFIDFRLKTAADWPKFKERLQPDSGRVPEAMDKYIADAETSGLPISINTASLMGWVRNWMGVENMSYLMYDEPDVYADMVNTLTDLTCWSLDLIIPRMKNPPDMGFGWEDICGKSGPLVSPAIFERCVAPGYRKIRAKLESYDVHLLGIDSDGDVAALVGPWLAAGVNVQFPIEIGTWNADPMAYRKKYGKNLRIIGGFNKLVLEHGRAAIDAEIERRMPLMKDGGFMLMPDHIITPGTPLADYRYFLDRMKTLRF